MTYKSDSESENVRSGSRTSRSRCRSTRVSNSTTRTESRSRSAFQSVQHEANKQRGARLQKIHVIITFDTIAIRVSYKGKNELV